MENEMRQFLLAGVAMLSGTAGLAPAAFAQIAQYPYTAPYGSMPVPVTGGFGPVSTYIPSFTTNPPLAAGTYTVRLGGRLGISFAAVSDSGRNPGYILGTATSPGMATNTKLAGNQELEYVRLYPSFDAVAGNGLKYGAYLDIWQDRAVAPGGGTNGSVSAADSIRGATYFRRETAYFGSDTYGFLRFGSTDQPTSLFETGTFENFDTGAWNNDFIGGPFTANAQPTFTFATVGTLYTAMKIVYLSPKFANLVDFGISFAPNTGNVSDQGGNCPYANTTATGIGCDATSSTSVAAETARRRNTLDGVVRVRTAFGPVGVAATAGGMYSGSVQYNGTAPSTGATGVPRLRTPLILI
jgi:hypothetical protein